MPRRVPRNAHRAAQQAQGRALAKRLGRPLSLTPLIGDAIVESVRNGNHITAAANAAGVSKSAVYNWLTWGEDAAAAALRGDTITDDQARLVEFMERVAHARALAEQDAVQVVRKVMEGGYVIEEEPILDSSGGVAYGPDGEPLMRRKFAPADGKVALEFLRRSAPERWAPRDQVALEVSGAGGGPIAVEQSVVVAGLAERLADLQAQRALEAAEDGDVVDGDVVEDDGPA